MKINPQLEALRKAFPNGLRRDDPPEAFDRLVAVHKAMEPAMAMLAAYEAEQQAAAKAKICDTIRAYADHFPAERATMDRALDLLSKASGDVTARRTQPAHITASLLILKDDELLTIWHPHLQNWLQPGGHVDPGEDIVAATLREAQEETGLTCDLHAWHETHAIPYDIDVLPVPENPRRGEPEHVHIDFRYLLTPRDDAPVTEAELPTAWHRFDAIGAISLSLARLGDKLAHGFVTSGKP